MWRSFGRGNIQFSTHPGKINNKEGNTGSGPNHCEEREEALNVFKLKTHFCPVCICAVILLTQLFIVHMFILVRLYGLNNMFSGGQPSDCGNCPHRQTPMNLSPFKYGIFVFENYPCFL